MYNLQDISILISNFLKESNTSIILIDGIEYLITLNDFNAIMRFLQTKRSRIEATKSTLIVPLFTDALEPKESKLIEREFEPITYLLPNLSNPIWEETCHKYISTSIINKQRVTKNQLIDR